MLEWLGERESLALFGFLTGILLGLAARVGRFCTLGALEDFHYGQSNGRLLMWVAALGTGIAGTFGAALLGWIDLDAALYLTRSPGIIAAAAGGLVFGVGMAMSGNCGFGALARLSGGEIRSLLIVLVMGISAMATLNGPLAHLRLALFERKEVTAETASLAYAIGARLGLPAEAIGLGTGLVLIAVALRALNLRQVAWGGLAGLAIALGFVGTSYVSLNGFDPVRVTSHSFSAPLGESVLYLMLSNGFGLSFAVGSIAGVLSGALAGSLLLGAFRWEACDDQRELRRQLAGAVLMGFGAVTAMGCSIGQGLSGFSMLAVTAPVTILSIWAGAFLGLRYLIEGRLLGRLN